MFADPTLHARQANSASTMNSLEAAYVFANEDTLVTQKVENVVMSTNVWRRETKLPAVLMLSVKIYLEATNASVHQASMEIRSPCAKVKLKSYSTIRHS